MRPKFHWQTGERSLALGERTLIMGIVNVTPDSFFDGGSYSRPDAAVQHGLRLLEEGADILDIGGESTRPGVQVVTDPAGKPGSASGAQVSEQEEMARVLPVIAGLKRLRPEAVLSVDTYKAGVARAAVEAGAEIVNDVSALRWDGNMAGTLAGLRCGVVLMHARGLPDEWRSLPAAENLLQLVAGELRVWAGAAMAGGIGRARLVLDPGFGFGKNFEENYPLLQRFQELHRLGFPLLAGTSRKGFIGKALGQSLSRPENMRPEALPVPPPSERLFGSLAAAVISIAQGAHIIRVHDVKESRQAAAVADAILAAAPPCA